MKPEPPIPADGSCAQCGSPRRPERSKKYGKAAAELDSFCSTECAKAWHGVERVGEALPTKPKVDPYISKGKLCACGCGQTTKVAEYNNQRRGHVAGEPVRYISHHNLRPPA